MVVTGINFKSFRFRTLGQTIKISKSLWDSLQFDNNIFGKYWATVHKARCTKEKKKLIPNEQRKILINVQLIFKNGPSKISIIVSLFAKDEMETVKKRNRTFLIYIMYVCAYHSNVNHKESQKVINQHE